VALSINDTPGFKGVVALDGPSGTGKSTVARRLADRLGVRYLDTGAMYRAATVAVLRAGIDPHDAVKVAACVAEVTIEVSTDPHHQRTLLDGDDVTAEIRSTAATAAVSPVSAVAAVRKKLVAQQRQLIAAGPIVVEGRDIGSVVWPHADVKVYLTASEKVRAQRRADEQRDSNIEEVADAIRRRDRFDSSRAISPLRRADGAEELDTSDLSIDGVVDLLAERAIGVGVHG
jgi:cytidylate kinase